ncbi:MAG: hypothetical protein ACYTAO_15210 [Planctomycetota bacterium]
MPQHYYTETGELDMDALLEHASGWGNVLLQEPGKARFAAIRSRLRESLREQDTPSAAKKYLTERLITTVGKSGKTSDLPKKLRDMIGNEDAQRAFVNDLQVGYAMLVPKMSNQDARQVVAAALDAAEEAGVPPEALESLRRMPSRRVMATAGPLATIAAGALLSRAPKDPGVRQAVLMASQLSPRKPPVGVRFPALPPPPGPAEPVSFAGRAAPPTAIVPTRPGGPIVPTGPRGPGVRAPGAVPGGEAAAGAAPAAGRKGIVGFLGRALKGKVIPIIGAGLAVWQIGSARAGARRRRELGAAMRITGEVPEELGGGFRVPTPEGGEISAGQFLAAMKERERQAKIGRFNAVTQEMDLTRDVLDTITQPSPEIEQLRAQQQGRRTQLPGRIRLGSARIPVAPQPRQTDDVMKQFDAILREAAGG